MQMWWDLVKRSFGLLWDINFSSYLLLSFPLGPNVSHYLVFFARESDSLSFYPADPEYLSGGRLVLLTWCFEAEQ